MKSVFAVPCSKCDTTFHHGIPKSVVMVTPYLEGPLYKLRCSAGHEALVQLGNPKHEILFQMGAYALLDGIYRDAVSTFASSLEEFWEFSFQVIAASRGVQPLPVPRVRGGHKVRFENSWREVLKTEPPVLTSEEYEIRNRIMHEGYVPTEGEAFDFGNKILVRITPAMQTLRLRLQEAVGGASAAIISDAKSRLNLGEPTAGIYDGTILHDNESMNYLRLEDYMSHLRNLDELFASLRDGSAA
jgi:hypothetical protein